MIHFETINYLESGNARQQSAYQTLMVHSVFSLLESFDPLLVGTIPIAVDIESSDLDICCHYTDKEAFIRSLQKLFGHKKQFCLMEREELRAVVCSFILDDFEIEIFGQDIPSRKQNGYRHMLIEYRLLAEKGEAFRQQIISLKKQGYKTEPAFALALGLTGDPFEELLKLESD